MRKKPLIIGVVINSKDNRFFDDVIAGMRQAEKEYADFALKVCIRYAKQYSAQQQITAIDELLADGSQMIILTPLNHSLMLKKIDSLVEQSIPVITVNSDIENSRRLLYVGCDYKQSGETAAQLAGLFTRGIAKVVIVTGSIRLLGHIQRINGFISVCKREYPDIRVVDIIENNDDDILSFQTLSNLLKSGCEPDLIYFGAAGIVGGLRAIDEYYTGKNHPLIITCDEIPEIREALSLGLVQATVSQQPFEQGYMAIRTGFNYAVNGIAPACETIYTKNEIKVKYNI